MKTTTADVIIWMAARRKTLAAHRLPDPDATLTVCGRSTRTGVRMSTAQAQELGAHWCSRCHPQGGPFTTQASPDPRRDATISGLRQMADWLEAHADVPVHGIRASYSAGLGDVTDAEGLSVLRRTAVAAGAPIDDEDDTHPSVTIRFGGGVTYEAHYVQRAAMARYEAAITYHNAVNPDAS